MAGVGALAFALVAGFVPDDDGDGGLVVVSVRVGVGVAVGRGDKFHVATVGGADVADVGVDVAAADGTLAGAEPGRGAAGGLVYHGRGAIAGAGRAGGR